MAKRSLRQLRESRFLTQKALAEKLGVHVNTIARLEQGENKRPRMGLFKAICDFFGVGPNEITFSEHAGEQDEERRAA